MGKVGRPKGDQNKKFREALDTLFRKENERKDDYE